MDKISKGRIVRAFVGYERGSDKPVFRPAMAVQEWTDTCANFQVFLDGTNELSTMQQPNSLDGLAFTADEMTRGTVWRTSLSHGKNYFEWTWFTEKEPGGPEFIV